jgi:hypothetical protein
LPPHFNLLVDAVEPAICRSRVAARFSWRKIQYGPANKSCRSIRTTPADGMLAARSPKISAYPA